MVSNPTDTKEYRAPENCEKCNQSLLEIQGKSILGQEYTLPKMEIIDGNVACFDETGTISEKKNF